MNTTEIIQNARKWPTLSVAQLEADRVLDQENINIAVTSDERYILVTNKEATLLQNAGYEIASR